MQSSPGVQAQKVGAPCVLRLRYLPNGVNTPFWGTWHAPGKVKHAAIVRQGVFTVFGGHGGPCVHTVAGVKPPPACSTLQACEQIMPLCGTTPHNATGWVCGGQHWVCGGVGGGGGVRQKG
jgi:hypothetical protein